MNEEYYEEQRKKVPSFGLEDYFVEKFTNDQFEYGSNSFGVCRYPLDSNGKRIVAVRVECPHTFGLDRASFHVAENILLITSYKGDTPNSIYFTINHEISDIYSSQLDLVDSDNIKSFVSRINQHMELTNKVISFNKFDKNADFCLLLSFKYDHNIKRISQVAKAYFKITDNPNKISFTATDNALTTIASLRKLDMEFFNRYYKHKIKEAFPEIGFDQLHEMIDVDKWSDSLKSLVKMSFY